MQRLFEIQEILLEQFKKERFYFREVFSKITLENGINGVIGSRGVGKTTLLLHHTLKNKPTTLYVSADNLFFLTNRLVDLVDYLYKQTDVTLLCVDEIHKYPNWKQELKNITDTYPSFKVLFSGSSMIDLISGKYDLSRRVTLYKLCGFSFREYLEFYHKKKIPLIRLNQLTKDHLAISQDFASKSMLKDFNDYLKFGYYPFFNKFSQEKEKFQVLNNSIQMAIYEDIATLHSLKTSSLSIIEKLYKYVINSSPGEVNASKLSNVLNKDFESISNYLLYLERAGLINFIYSNSSGKTALKNPIKMYPENTNMIFSSYLPISDDLAKGKIRETFFVNQIQNNETPIFYSKTGDFEVQNLIFEIGGKNKTSKQLKGKEGFVLSDNLLIGSKEIIPLYLFGFLN